MEISRVIAQFLETLRPGSEAQIRTESVDKTFQELIKQQTETAGQPDKISAKTLLHQNTLHLNQTPLKHDFYTKQGQIIRLSVFKNETQSKLLDSNSILNQSAALAHQQEFKWPADLMATLMQMSFDFIREQLKREQRKKRKPKEGEPELPDGKAEEAAFELLEILFEQADDSEDKDAYCDWAESAIDRAETDLRERYTNLPPEVELRFKIMHDAILAIRHGIEPDYILERLKQEMKRKKDNQ